MTFLCQYLRPYKRSRLQRVRTRTSLGRGGTLQEDLKVLLSPLPKGAKAKLLLLVVVQFVTSLMDLIGLAAVVPLMEVVTGANLDQGYLRILHDLTGNPSRGVFVIFLAGGMVLAFAAKMVMTLVVSWKVSAFVGYLQLATASRLLQQALNETYHEHKKRNTAELTRAISTSSFDAHYKVLGGFLGLMSHALSIASILGFLLFAMPIPTLVALGYFAGAVFLLQAVLAPRNRAAGIANSVSSYWSSRTVIEAMAGFREIRMHNAQQEFVNRYYRYGRDNVEAGRRSNFYGVLPRYTLEFTTITGLAILLVVVTATSENPAAMVPTLTLFVAAAIKLLPTLAALSSTIGQIQQGREGLRITAEYLVQWRNYNANQHRDKTQLPAGLSTLEVKDLSFTYPDGDSPVVRNVSLHVPPGTSLALCGSSGSGKTTLVDLMLGLLEPNTGSVTYADTALADVADQWRDLVAYVPQDVFLMDDTLAENIAFGVPKEQIDRDRVLEAARRAKLETVIAELPEGLDTKIGERGSRLSGGQRQRVGIARALYRQPRVIFLDEATSALDNSTENEIAQTISSLSGQVTTVIVAHRLSTVRDVDQLAYLEDGEIVALGSFEQVQEQAEGFAELVRLGSLEKRS